MKILFASFCLCLAFSIHAAPIYNVHDFGATGDGQTYDTAAIQKALDTCGNSGGTVEFPAGIYLSKPLVLRTRTTVLLDAGAKLMATTNQSDFMKVPGDWLKAKSGSEFNAFIRGTDLTDITFTGAGTIDGNGYVWWGEAEKARQISPGYTLPRPGLIALENCRKVLMRDITLQNSPEYHFVPSGCEDVVVSNLTVLAPAGAANTDAIDPRDCENVLITKCHVSVGDDNVAISSHKGSPQRRFSSENITVTDCVFLDGHGMSIGSGTSGGVRNVTVKRCVFIGTQNGIRIKSQRGRGGLVQNIVFDDISMSNVDPAITFTMYYSMNSAKDPVQQPLPKNDQAQPVTGETPIFRDIHVSNMTATCQNSAGMIIGLPESLISDVTFKNVKISAVTGLKIENAKGIDLHGLQLTTQQGKPFIVQNAQVEGLGGR
ncbi:MAG TPA: glycoside hydrolase family 28 protein [Verrucomicrobiae bacterium]|jgi:polygalacturonase